MTNINHLGRRSHFRLKTTYLVCYRAKQEDDSFSHYDYTLTRDISSGGLFIMTDIKFSRGTEIDMIIRLPLYPDMQIKARGTVINFDRNDEKKLIYRTRIKFTEFNEEVFSKINAFIEQEMRKVDKNGVMLSAKLDRRKKRNTVETI